MPFTRIVAVITCCLPLAAAAQTPPAAEPAHHAHAPADSAAPDSSEAFARQIAAVREATAPYQDIEAAREDGYVLFAGGEAPLMGEHWYRKDLVRDSLDLERPSTLQYAMIGGERRLVGVAYTAYQRPGDPMPEGFAGSSDRWHVHDIPMLARAVSEGRPLLRWLVNRRIASGKVGVGDGRTQLVMVHAWIWLDNPDGMFALRHRALPYLQAGLPAEWAALEGADENAARGLMLLASYTCTREIRLADRLSDLSGRQSRALRTACEAAARDMRAARDSVGSERALPDDRETARVLNAAAAAAWRAWIEARDRTLTPAQLEKLRAILEHAEVPM